MIAGIDEAGRGAWAGNVIAAAVILPEQYDLPGLTDSKKLTPKKRDILFDAIMEQAVAVGVGQKTPAEIDHLNILVATLQAMSDAVSQLTVMPNAVWVDGNQAPQLTLPTRCIIGGDLSEPAIAAASIIAKVTRDRQLIALDLEYPEYGFASHKGYGTKKHQDALVRYGVLPIHRKSYRPVKVLL